MKKRIAYIGLSYPLLYDYRNQAPLSKNDLTDSPNPIIESPLGLIILYDELWFLCESICSNNMRKLPYVKFVDEMFPDLYYEGADLFRQNCIIDVDENVGLSYKEIIHRMNINGWSGLDNHTHGIQVGNIRIFGNSGKSNLEFDIYIYIFMALQERSIESIELITNSRFCMNDTTISAEDANVVEKIVISNIPNYLNKEGPYHPCMEELRENQYLADFRKWVIKNHNTFQNSEINEICTDVNRTIKDTQERVFNKYLEDNSKYTFFKSSGKTIIKTIAGIVSTPISIVDALAGITIKGKNALKVNSDRWQGFVVQSRNIVNSNKL